MKKKNNYAERVIHSVYERKTMYVICPHCKAFIVPVPDYPVLMVACAHCKDEIDFRKPKAREKNISKC